eukprot:2496955-Ditylum_brightwellii.AAC.1
MDVRFQLGKAWLHQNSPHLHVVDSVSVTFNLQKREKERGEIVTMHRTRDSQLNPVTYRAFTVRRISNPDSSPSIWGKQTWVQGGGSRDTL